METDLSQISLGKTNRFLGEQTGGRKVWVNICLHRHESESEVAQSCPTLCNPVDCSLPGSSLHGILQAKILEWVAISFSNG